MRKHFLTRSCNSGFQSVEKSEFRSEIAFFYTLQLGFLSVEKSEFRSEIAVTARRDPTLYNVE